MFFSRSGQNCDSACSYVVKTKPAVINRKSKGNQVQNENVTEKKCPLDREKFVKFCNASIIKFWTFLNKYWTFLNTPVTKFWCNVVRYWFFNIHTCYLTVLNSVANLAFLHSSSLVIFNQMEAQFRKSGKCIYWKFFHCNFLWYYSDSPCKYLKQGFSKSNNYLEINWCIILQKEWHTFVVEW